ncbi:MAG: hypothetical protein U0892_18660 [Pirellulales bacterium]
MIKRFTLGICILLLAGMIALGQDIVVADFESSTYGDWKILEGTAFGLGPTDAHKLQVTGHQGSRLVNSFGTGDSATGMIASPPIEINRRFLSFLIGGGQHEGQTGLELIVDGKVFRSATGMNSAQLRRESWDVTSIARRKDGVEHAVANE